MNEKGYLRHILKSRKLTLGDKITLITFFIIDIACATITHISIEDSVKTKAMICIFIPFIAFFLINSTSFANRFTNFSFSLIFFILSVCFILSVPNEMTKFDSVPLFEFTLYQILRFAFWKKYGLEFIPAQMDRNKVEDHYNEVEQRQNNKDDKRYMKYLLWTGMVILFACMCSLVGLHL